MSSPPMVTSASRPSSPIAGNGVVQPPLRVIGALVAGRRVGPRGPEQDRPPSAWIRDTSVIAERPRVFVEPSMRCSNPSRIPTTSHPVFTASIVAAEITEFIPGAGPRRTGSPSSSRTSSRSPAPVRDDAAPGVAPIVPGPAVACKDARRIAPAVMAHVLAIDAGTTGVTALLVDDGGGVVAQGVPRVPAVVPPARMGRTRPRRLVGRAHRGVPGGVRGRRRRGPELAAIGITNQRETTVLWDRGDAARRSTRAIVWQDRRTAALATRSARRGSSRTSASAPAWSSTPTSRAPRCTGCSTTSRGARGRRGRNARVRDPGLVRPGALSGGAVHATDHDERLPDAAVRHPRARLGRPAARTPRRPARGAPGGPAVVRTVRRDRSARRSSAPSARRRHRRRPAGGAVRPGVLRGRAPARTRTARGRSC